MQQKSKEKMNTIFGLLAIMILAIGTYLTLSNSIIAIKMNSWQASVMGDGKYFPALTIFLLSLPPLLILMAVKKIVQKNSFLD